MRKKVSKEYHLLSALGGSVRDRRLRFNMSQQELADSSHVHRTYISDIERGARNLTVATLCRIADALEVSLSKLFRQAEQESSPRER